MDTGTYFNTVRCCKLSHLPWYMMTYPRISWRVGHTDRRDRLNEWHSKLSLASDTILFLLAFMKIPERSEQHLNRFFFSLICDRRKESFFTKNASSFCTTFQMCLSISSICGRRKGILFSKMAVFMNAGNSHLLCSKQNNCVYENPHWGPTPNKVQLLQKTDDIAELQYDLQARLSTNKWKRLYEDFNRKTKYYWRPNTESCQTRTKGP